jgi:RNA polymerase sigma-70 factor (ECF subfamily)
MAKEEPQTIRQSPRTNEQWLTELRSPEPVCNAALQDLHTYLTQGLVTAFASRKQLGREDLLDFAQESRQKILRSLDTFRGNCKFTTWALKVAINHTISELRRKRWQDISLDELEYPEQLFSQGRGLKIFERPEKRAMRGSVIELLNRVIREDLTDKQRRAVTARFLHGIPPSHIAREMNTSRGAVYKLLHDARRRMKTALEEHGLDAEELGELFR